MQGSTTPSDDTGDRSGVRRAPAWTDGRTDGRAAGRNRPGGRTDRPTEAHGQAPKDRPGRRSGGRMNGRTRGRVARPSEFSLCWLSSCIVALVPLALDLSSSGPRPLVLVVGRRPLLLALRPLASYLLFSSLGDSPHPLAASRAPLPPTPPDPQTANVFRMRMDSTASLSGDKRGRNTQQTDTRRSRFFSHSVFGY